LIRLASAALLLAIVVGTIWALPAWATVAVAAMAAAAAAAELASLAAHYRAPVPGLYLPAASALVTVAFAFDSVAIAQLPALHVVLLAAVVAGGAVTLAAGPPDAGTLTRAAVVALAPLYIGLPLGALAAIRVIDGPGPLLLLLAIVAASDSAQYYTGRAVGRRKLSPAVSPAKTVEGAIGGLLAAAIAAAAVGPMLVAPRLLAPATAAVLGAGLAVTGITGDLFESLLKRGAGVKDSSHLIPGHGGVLDRIDSYLFAGPVYFVFLRLTA
jgi:phosphatidate cytidylyltransferase